MNKLPSFKDVLKAHAQIKDHCVHTAILSNDIINQLLGMDVFFKCENQQHIGAFKFRGAYNAISTLSDGQKSNGVIAYSSGNHAQAVARVCQILHIPAVIVMPSNAPLIKRKATESYNATVIEYDVETESREEIAEEIKNEKSLTLIPPFNHPGIIAGQGTVALELLQDQPNLQQVFAPCGGGGLLSGTALASKGVNPQCKVYGVEPELADDATQSFHQGKIVTIDYPNTIADGARTLSVGDITFPLIQQNVDDMLTVSESMIKEAVRLLFYHLKQVVEPSGALGLAALLSQKYHGTTQNAATGVILSGGNIDAMTLTQILAEESIFS